MVRTLIDVLTTPSYVSLIEGPPGAGKTSLALKACAKRGRCTYISYTDPERSLLQKMKSVERDFKGKIKVVNILSGNVESAFSEIQKSLASGELVVLDTLDAMFYGIKDENSIRPFLQILYGSLKYKDSSMIMITEGINPVAQQIRFVADAIISMNFREILGKKLRTAELLKDRDNVIEQSLYFITFTEGFRILEPFLYTRKPKLGSYHEMVMPPGMGFEIEKELGNNVLIEFDSDVAEVRASLLRKFHVAYFLKLGLTVNYVIGPNEDESSFISDMKTLVGDIKKLNIVHMDAREAGYSSEDYFRQHVSQHKPNSVDVVNLLADEDFASKDPVEYEKFVKRVTVDEIKNKTVARVLGYVNREATRVQEKYANVLRRITVTDGFTFWRSIKPPSQVYFIEIKPEEGKLNYIEMR